MADSSPPGMDETIAKYANVGGTGTDQPFNGVGGASDNGSGANSPGGTPSGSDSSGGISGMVGSAIASGLTGLFESMASGLAHTVNVILNNMWYGLLAIAGGVIAIAGFWMLLTATPAGQAVGSVVKSGASAATKALPFL